PSRNAGRIRRLRRMVSGLLESVTGPGAAPSQGSEASNLCGRLHRHKRVRSELMTGVTKSDRLVRSRSVRGCSSKLAARRLAVLLGLAAVFALPAASGAASPANKVAE